MIPIESRQKRLSIYRNTRASFLLGASWSHAPEWPQRKTHLYLGLWVLTITSGRETRP